MDYEPYVERCIAEPEDRPDKVKYAITGAYFVATVILLIITIYVFVKTLSPLYVLIGGIFLTSLALLAWFGSDMTVAEEDEMIRSGVLAITIIIVVSLLTTMSNNFTGDHRLLSLIIFIALISVLLTVPDFYFGKDWIPLTRHIRIAAQIVAVACVAICVTMFYLNRRCIGWTANSPCKSIASKMPNITNLASNAAASGAGD